VAVSTDSWFNGWPSDSGHYACSELASPDRWMHVVRELRDRHYTESDLKKIFSYNWLRVFKEVLEP
ncbi:MAG: membrane dipeptidase, partial [Verrucomicrobiota bacterium]